MAQSDQERLFHKISSASFSGGSVFFPRNCPNNREPADLAWVSGSDAILFYMTGGKKDRRRQDLHNLKQAKWWVRNWQAGLPLESECGRFTYERSQISRIFVCLINDAPNDDIFYIGIDRLAGINGLCSISIRFALNFFFFYPNAYDLIAIMTGSTDADGDSEDLALEILKKSYKGIFHQGAHSISGHLVLSSAEISAATDSAVEIIKEEISKKSNFSVDLSFADTAWISGALYAGTKHVVDSARENGEQRFAWARHMIRGRTFIVLVAASIIGSEEAFKKVIEENPSDNFLLICKWGGLPIHLEAWSYILGVSLGPDPRDL